MAEVQRVGEIIEASAFYPSLIKQGFSLSLFHPLLRLRHKFNESEDVLGFSDDDKILHDLPPFLASSSTILIIQV